MKKIVMMVVITILGGLFVHCGGGATTTIESLCQDEKPDGFIDDWTMIVPIDPPPPAPFRFLHGAALDLNEANPPGVGRDSQVVVHFTISMGAVGEIRFQAGGAPGVMAATRQIEEAMNSWQFSNNGWGPVMLVLNYGRKSVKFDFADFNLLDRVELNRTSFYSGFRGRKGEIEFSGVRNN